MREKMILKNKKGISLMTLIITIVVAIILVATSVGALNSNFIATKKNAFVYEIITIEDAVDAYYTSNNVLPIKNEESAKTKSEVIAVAKTPNVVKYNESKVEQFLEDEIKEAEDEDAYFYEIDMGKFELESGKLEGVYYLSFPNLNVYNLRGEKIEGKIYFSKVNMIESDKIPNSKSNIMSAKNGISLNIKYNKGILTNKLGVKIELDTECKLDITLKYKDLNGIEKDTTKSTISAQFFEFDTIEELNTNYTNEEFDENVILEFNKATKKSIELNVKSDDKVIASEILDVSNYDPVKPSINKVDIKEYTNMKVLNIKVQENRELSSLKYQYMKKIVQQDKTVTNYYDNIESFDLEKAINVDISNESIENGQDIPIQIKLPMDVATVCVVATDKAGNISDEMEMACVEDIGVVCNIKASVSSPTKAKNITYTFEFDQEVEGFDISDIVVKNGTKGSFEGSGKTYTLEVDNSEYKKVTQEVSIASNVCTSKENKKGNYAKSIKIEIDRIEKFSVKPSLLTIPKG